VHRGEHALDLTAKEFALLEYFMRNAGTVLTRRELIEHVWDFAFDGDPHVLTVYVGYLRDKIDRPFGRASLETVRAVGYRLRDDRVPSPSH
jgi:DNA-binding response OmpR family regulator